MLRVLKKREEGGCWVCEPLPLDFVSSRGSGWRPVWVVALMPHSLPNTLIAHSHTDSGHNTSLEEKKKKEKGVQEQTTGLMSGPGLANVSISFTSAVVYAVSGLIFLLLIFLLVLMGVSNCDCHCSRSENTKNQKRFKRF